MAPRTFAVLHDDVVRAWLVLLLFATGCDPMATSSAPYGLSLKLAFDAPAQPVGEVSVSSATLHLTGLRAVSDRSSSDARAWLDRADLALGDQMSAELPEAPPGLYAGLDAQVGGGEDEGVDLQGIYKNVRVHVTISSVRFDVGCATPAMLERGHPVELTISTGLTRWFDGVDLSAVSADSDDNGIIISADDNADLAALISDNIARSFQLDCVRQ
jgi:hypothetical protein